MEGEQYELWGLDEAPLPSQLARIQPEHHPVECRLCRTLMYALPDELGTEMVCPDCGAKTVAEASASNRPQPEPDILGDAYELDESSPPPLRPTPVPVAVKEAERHEQARQQRAAARRRNRPETRAQPPRIPLLQRVPAMLLTSPVLARWIALSIALLMVLWLGVPAFASLGAGGGFGAISAVCFFAVAVVLGAMTYAVAASVWLALLTESADGHDRLHDPPGAIFFEWTGPVAYVSVAAAASLLPGWAIGRLLEAFQIDARAIVIPAFWLACFPVALLSALDQDSPMAVISMRLASSLWKCLPAWLLFYLETLLLAGGVAAAIAGLWNWSAVMPLIAGPLVVAATFLYFRLLGRLAWWLAEWLAEPA